MNTIYTKEFIDLASKIQDMKPEGRYVIGQDGRRWLRDALAGTKDWDDVGRNPILLPSLGWLVRKLNESSSWHITHDPEYEKWECSCFLSPHGNEILEYADTPELAALRALIKIKGIDHETV